MNYRPEMNVDHRCLLCGENTLRVKKYGWGNGHQIEVECTNEKCKSTGTIGNIPPWYGTELPLAKVRAMFAMAEIPIEGEPLRLENQYHNPTLTGNKVYYHPWWFVKTPRGWIMIGWRKRVIEIEWKETDIRHVVTEDQVTKGEDHVHAYSEEDAIKYLKELWHYATTSTAHLDD